MVVDGVAVESAFIVVVVVVGKGVAFVVGFGVGDGDGIGVGALVAVRLIPVSGTPKRASSRATRFYLSTKQPKQKQNKKHYLQSQCYKTTNLCHTFSSLYKDTKQISHI